uniref:Odorant receptor n=1 Tax=Lutzomyia longipalpis TaxID=7200 RepID=A0A240SXT7_LUTLO
MSLQMEEFIKAKPRIDFLMSHLTLNAIPGSRKNCFVIYLLALLNGFFISFVLLHLMNVNFQINFNTLITFLTISVISGYGFRICVGFLKKDMIKTLLQNIKELFEVQEDDEELSEVLKKHLMGSMRIFAFCNRWGTNMYIFAGVMCGFYFRYNEDYGFMYELPFIVSDNMLWKEFLYILQGFFYITVATTMIFLDIGIVYLGLQVIAEFNILSDYMKLLNEKFKSEPKFLSKIIIRHFSVFQNVNLLSDIISETSFLQLVFSFISLLFGFTFIIEYATGLGNYIIVLCGGGLAVPICILGEFIRARADQLPDTFYQTNWYEISLKDQKTFLIILGMAQREYGLKAAGMYDINIYTFFRITQIAFSYCAVLYSLSK